MKAKFHIAFSALVCLLWCSSARSADVQVQLSAQKAWVGTPVILQIVIENAADYSEPVLPGIDGCDVRSAGAASQSSQVTIINGRRSERRSVVLQYLITPQRVGTFQIPPMKLKVDGKTFTTDARSFTATQSETGDLMFVEIAGSKEHVYVGQALELTLKIWLKPYQDSEFNVELSEGNLWQLISDQTSWGSFSDRLKELADNNQRPGGREVQHADADGQQAKYYLYEITATAYPRKPGRIDADDVRIVVNYPVAFGRTRDPFSEMFGRGRAGFDDDFFASPFGNRLSITETRPITATAKVDETEVLPVPETGRPEDYRGAIGRYTMIAQGTPDDVSVGDSITLSLGIVGTGPMELVQAPPLSELPDLIRDFRVTDQSLAGLVQDNSKLFTTTIRPRRDDVREIPAIPFSFFDPDQGTYETVYSEAIPIIVRPGSNLSLDAIVGSQPGRQSTESATQSTSPSLLSWSADFSNSHSPDILNSEPPTKLLWPLAACVGIPAGIWLTSMLVLRRRSLLNVASLLKSPAQRCRTNILAAADVAELVPAFVSYVSERSRHRCENRQTAIGQLRISGFSATANDLEAFLEVCDASEFHSAIHPSLDDAQQTAQQLLTILEQDFSRSNHQQVRPREAGESQRRTSAGSVFRSLLLLTALTSLVTPVVAAPAITENNAPSGIEHSVDGNSQTVTSDAEVTLSNSQKQALLAEAGDLYQKGSETASQDAAEAAALFAQAANKYQLLVESGIQNSRLYVNLGNAYLQSRQVGRAIANYQRAIRRSGDSSAVRANLTQAESQVVTESGGVFMDADEGILGKADQINDQVIRRVGIRSMLFVAAVSSLALFSLLMWRSFRVTTISRWWAVAPLVLVLVSSASVCRARHSLMQPLGLVVVDEFVLRKTDALEAPETSRVSQADGLAVRVLETRPGFVLVRLPNGHQGWASLKDMEVVAPAE
ncbi:MAG: BatD family protein [Planctomycetaceae bacterium]